MDTTFLDGGQPSPVVSECLANDREPCRKPSHAEHLASLGSHCRVHDRLAVLEPFTVEKGAVFDVQPSSTMD